MVILDAQLTGISWSIVLRQLRSSEKAKKLPVILLTDGKTALPPFAGELVSAQITMPIDSQQFAQTLERCTKAETASSSNPR